MRENTDCSHIFIVIFLCHIYSFAADTNLNAYKILYRASDFAGASHGDEICYLFRCNLNPKLYESVTIDSVEMKTAKRMAKVWANFAKFG